MNKDALLSYIKRYYDPESKGVFKLVKEKQRVLSDTMYDCTIDCCYACAPIDDDLIVEPTWQSYLFDLIDEKGFDEVEVYKNAGITKQTFSKIRSNSNYHPDKDTVIMLCFGLKLSYNDSIEFLEKAGYTLSKSIKRDVIVAYFLKNEVHDIYELDNTFEEFKEKRILKC